MISPKNKPKSTINDIWRNTIQEFYKGNFREVEKKCLVVLKQKPNAEAFQQLLEKTREKICQPIYRPNQQQFSAVVCLNVKADQPITLYFDETPKFDLCLFDYSGKNYVPPISVPISYYYSEKTEGKGHIMDILSRKLPDSFSYYGFLDDDILISVSDINRMLFIANIYDLDLFQASLSLDSYINFPHLGHKHGYKIKEASLVEIMMPFLSNYAYQNTKKVFSECLSGWGLDFVISRQLFNENRKIAIIHDAIASHLRPTSSSQWKCSNGLTSVQEFQKLINKYNLSKFPIF